MVYKYKLLESDNIDAMTQLSKLFICFEKKEPEYCSKTIMYRDSRQLMKMQKLNKNILTTWNDDDTLMLKKLDNNLKKISNYEK